MTEELVTMLLKEMRLWRVALEKNTAATAQLSGVMSTIANDVRSTREKVNVIEARVPYPRRKKAANG